tara:strand:- start:132 stop:314 length:183 start_codon:yes stop_codon:yes gene_type:complete
MADFCLDCTHEMFGDEFPSDFKGLLSQEEFEEGYLLPVLCEGCGYIWVDPQGQKIEEKNE